MGTQNTARLKAHGGVEGGRSNGGDFANETSGTTDEDRADGDRDPDKVEEARWTEVEMGAWQTGAESVGLGTKAKP